MRREWPGPLATAAWSAASGGLVALVGTVLWIRIAADPSRRCDQFTWPCLMSKALPVLGTLVLLFVVGVFAMWCFGLGIKFAWALVAGILAYSTLIAAFSVGESALHGVGLTRPPWWLAVVVCAVCYTCAVSTVAPATARAVRIGAVVLLAIPFLILIGGRVIAGPIS